MSFPPLQSSCRSLVPLIALTQNKTCAHPHWRGTNYGLLVVLFERSTACRMPPAPTTRWRKAVSALFGRLDRDEDNHAFQRGVTEVFPHLKDDYLRVCPTPMDFNRMRDKLAGGSYAVGDLGGIREDLKLIVENCVRYNGPESEVGKLAAAFADYAQVQLDQFVRDYDAAFFDGQAAGTAKGKVAGEKRGRDETVPDGALVDGPLLKGKSKKDAMEGEKSSKANTVPSISTKPDTSSPAADPSQLVVPSTIRRLTERSFHAANSGQLVLSFPAPRTASFILASFLETTTKATSDETVLSNYRTVVKVLGDMFDAALPRVLLYDCERLQLLEMLQSKGAALSNSGCLVVGGKDTETADVSWAKVFGAEHLSRLALHLPRVLDTVAGGEVVGRLLLSGYLPVIEDLLLFIEANAEDLGIPTK